MSLLTQETTSAFHGLDIPDYEVIVNCMHCGLCLPHCPTYALTGLERSSPRGRIRLIKAVADGELPISQTFVDEMNFCLDCQACESACPAGVKYGSLVEAARVQMFEQGFDGFFTQLIKRLILDWAFSNPKRIRFLARSLRLIDSSGLKMLLSKTKILNLFSNGLTSLLSLAPSISDRFSSVVLPEVIKPNGPIRYRIGFLTGCIMDVAYAEVNLDTIELLLRHDCEVIIPREQVCCGSLQAHNGDLQTARRLARRNIEAFENARVDAIIMNSAGCGAFMKEYGHALKDDLLFAERANAIATKTKDITEFLVEIGFRSSTKPTGIISTKGGNSLINKRLTYHDACHLVHTQKVSDQPRRLIRSIPGIEFVEMNESTWCCGSAGIYNIVRFDDAMQLLRRKLDNIKKVRPEIIVTGNPGCLAQIAFGLDQEGLPIELIHTATFLRRASEV